MNTREIGEIRRHIRRDRSNMTAIYGCYVNENKEIISEFRQSTGMMSENEGEKYFAVLKRTLSGTIGKNLIDINFKTSQVAGSEEHKLLMDLRQTGLKDDALRMMFYRKVIESVALDENYLILLGCDSYDVPFRGKDGESRSDNSEETYTFLLCAICPVKQTQPKLHYVPEEKQFHDGGITNVVCAPELGFLFPAFDNRSTNIYNALYYTHSVKESHQAFVDAVFHTDIPKPAAEQKQSFEALLGSALDEECSLDVVQTVHDRLCQRIELHKESRVPEPLMVSKQEVKEVLSSCGVSEPHLAKFSVDYDEAFGFEADLHPKNIIDDKRFEIKTPDVSIKVAPDRADLIETRIIGGVKYILICAEEDVEVNGVSIHIGDKEAATV
ncbi:MAG: DUF4317 domain-containing protein [Oscillospiraceae bacterium]|nr:DUF4317 domain-containing protein [Oscillospiraceae bacterium]